MAQVIIFGTQDTAELAYYYLTKEGVHNIVAFAVNKEFMPLKPVFCGLPVVEFENVEKRYPPTDYAFFAPMTAKDMNKSRMSVYSSIKKLGYACISYISPKASVFTENIGDNCFVLEDNTIQPFVKIGNNVVLWSGNHIGHHSVIDDHVFFTSHVVLSGHCVVKPYCFFGVNSTIRNATTIAEGSFVAMSASITRDTEPWSVYKGNPAKKMDYSSLDVKF